MDTAEAAGPGGGVRASIVALGAGCMSVGLMGMALSNAAPISLKLVMLGAGVEFLFATADTALRRRRQKVPR